MIGFFNAIQAVFYGHLKGNDHRQEGEFSIFARTMSEEIIEEKKEEKVNPFLTPIKIIEPEHKLPDYTFDMLPEEQKNILRGHGWTDLMPVQRKTIPYMLAARDMLVQSKTGSGKTGAYVLPLLQVIVRDHVFPQALILVPTRELCLQVQDEIEKFFAIEDRTTPEKREQSDRAEMLRIFRDVLEEKEIPEEKLKKLLDKDFAKDVSLEGYTDETLLNEVDGMTDMLYEKQGSYLQGKEDDRKEVAKILIDAGKLTPEEAVTLLHISKRDIQPNAR